MRRWDPCIAWAVLPALDRLPCPLAGRQPGAPIKDCVHKGVARQVNRRDHDDARRRPPGSDPCCPSLQRFDSMGLDGSFDDEEVRPDLRPARLTRDGMDWEQLDIRVGDQPVLGVARPSALRHVGSSGGWTTAPG
jgi:hypothetical protein